MADTATTTFYHTTYILYETGCNCMPWEGRDGAVNNLPTEVQMSDKILFFQEPPKYRSRFLQLLTTYITISSL